MREMYEPSIKKYPVSRSRSSFWNKKEWTHVELGAANYGKNSYTDSTYTIGKLSANRHTLLFKTVDKLIENKGIKGLIYINDLTEKLVNSTIKQLKKYMIDKYPDNQIALEPLVGDFFKIDIPKVTSMHLKNPEYWFFLQLDEPRYKKRLEYFANQSKEGLVLATYFKRPFLNRVNQLGIGYKVVQEDFEPYVHADGTVISHHGNVVEFSIKSLSALEQEGTMGFLFNVPYSPQEDRLFDLYGPKADWKEVSKENYIDPKFVPK